MSVIKYTENGTYNIGQAAQDGFGIEWQGESALIGLKLRDRKKPSLKVEIVNIDWFMGIFRVHYKKGGWQCFDHCINQFKLDETK